MRQITLPGTDITTTALGFGCAGLMRAPTRRQRLALLSAAYDSGIRHFDAARMYGLGAVEGELGRFLRGKRDGVVVASKFGIEVAARNRLLVGMQGIARRIIALSPGLRGMVRRKSTALYQPRKYDVETARTSLHTSLKELGTDYLDIYFLHEPGLADVENTGVLEFLERAHADGLIRAYGVAGYPETLLPICKTLPALAEVAQVPNDVVKRQLKLFDRNGAATITFGPYSNAIEVISGHLVSASAARRWSDAAGCDMSDADNVARFLLKYCLNENSGGVVLFSTTNARRIGPAAELAGGADIAPEAMAAFVALVDNEIIGARAATGD